MTQMSLTNLRTKTHSLPHFLQTWILITTNNIGLISESSEEIENSSIASNNSNILSNLNHHRMYPLCHNLHHHQLWYRHHPLLYSRTWPTFHKSYRRPNFTPLTSRTPRSRYLT